MPGTGKRRTNLRIHFVHRNVNDTEMILDDRNSPHPLHYHWDMFVPQAELNFIHPGTAMRAWEAEQKRH